MYQLDNILVMYFSFNIM